MRRYRPNSIDDNGYDSFLDIVANLVGILVILIMVVGIRARNAWQVEATPAIEATPLVLVEPKENPQAKADADHEQALNACRDEIAAIEQRTVQLEHDAVQIKSRAATIAEQTAIKTEQRKKMQLVISAVENEIRNQRDQLEGDQQTAFDGAQQIAAAETQLEELRSHIRTVSLETLAPTELTHHPTPLAKTVLGREEHFRLLGGRIVRVPLDELVEALRNDARSKLWKMKEADEFTESLSPLDGFRLKYTMKRIERVLETPNGRVRQRSIELDRFTLYPVADNLGEPVAAALNGSSAFGQRLAQLVPADTAITVWTYPDSYKAFRELQDHLVERGFRVAARPLPEGHPIGGSPSGNRSAAQ